MRTLLKAMSLLLLFAGSTLGQGIPHNISTVTGPNGQPRPGATVSFCQHPANAVPCANYANSYNDIGLTILINQAATPIKTDGLGNVPTFYAAPGIYDYTVSGTGITAPNGPYVINLSPSVSSSNNWTGPKSFSQPITSTVTTGTAPFSIASTTQVTNLNTQLHGGLSAPASAIVGISDSQTLTNKALTAPTIDGFGAAHVATQNSTANFGVALSTQTIVSSVPASGMVFVQLLAVQTLVGVGCSNVTNSVQPTLFFTAPGGTAESYGPAGIAISVGGAWTSAE